MHQQLAVFFHGLEHVLLQSVLIHLYIPPVGIFRIEILDIAVQSAQMADAFHCLDQILHSIVLHRGYLLGFDQIWLSSARRQPISSIALIRFFIVLFFIIYTSTI